MTPYQYSANNPIYFIDVNGDYIFIHDNGKKYKFNEGKLYGRDHEGNWAECTPEAGGFLERTFSELKAMYEFSTTSGGDSNSGNSFSNSFLSYFNNEKNNAVLFDMANRPTEVQKILNKSSTKMTRTGTLKMGA